MVTQELRALFPFFEQNPGAIYLDSNATTLRPRATLLELSRVAELAGNPGRGGHHLSRKLEQIIERTRERVASFLSVNPSEIAFTSGATDSLNLIPLLWGEENLRDGDEIIICNEDHLSAVAPWRLLSQRLARRGIHLSIIELHIDGHGDYSRESLLAALSPRTRLIAVSHIHHVTGMEMDVDTLRSRLRSAGREDVLVSLDAAQSVSHIPVRPRQLEVDFLAFSAHKMFGAFGAGVLWARQEILSGLTPARVGGKVERSQSGRSLAELVECGTQNPAAIASLVPALDLIAAAGIEAIGEHLLGITRRLVSGLQRFPSVEFAPGPARCGCTVGHGTISFSVDGVDSWELSQALENDGIFVRAGAQCMAKSDKHYVRASAHLYTTESEVDAFCAALGRIL